MPSFLTRSSAVSLMLCLTLLASAGVHAQGPREHTRLKGNRSTAVTESQATELTLTLTEVAVRPIQVWVRTAGIIEANGKTITASVPAVDGRRIKIGQRVRAFPPESRSSMYQAFVSSVRVDGGRGRVAVTLSNPAREGSTRYLLEIVTDEGDRLSVPNEALIERGGTRLVYVQQDEGKYLPREIEAGVQGELYTEVRSGLKAGEQVVTFGSFFIDAEHTLKGSS
jgi:Cu(I)/Ag(I) efflux system membrane fusion protein